ncbi:bacterioferritin-associated ferredoxin [Streptomyces sp. V3I8]|uniref:(2Fe-2S)-binding protein n=1 Tax=Streptomyces sp. V3I8 TaxID=3042279 RepID=UPI0027D86F0B|nr:(2Fe-2S)-binding protein [Streptomyces sp. V3I8]
MFVCNCFGVTEAQVKKHAADGACTPRQIASACKAGTDCGSCVRRIQALLGRDGRDGLQKRERAGRGVPVRAEMPERLEEAA